METYDIDINCEYESKYKYFTISDYLFFNIGCRIEVYKLTSNTKSYKVCDVNPPKCILYQILSSMRKSNKLCNCSGSDMRYSKVWIRMVATSVSRVWVATLTITFCQKKK